MTDPAPKAPDVPGVPDYRGPVVEVYAPASYVSYVITQQELGSLDSAMGRELTVQGFFTLALGSLIATAIAWGVTDHISDGARAVYAGSTIALGLFAAGFGALYYQARRERPALVESLKAKTVRAKLMLVDTPPAP